MMKSVELLAPAKLNLFLHITGKRADGYHNLQTIFQLLDYADELHFELRDDGEINLRCNEKSLNNNNNLVMRAAQLIHQAANPKLGADIYLEKKIPMGAGLGGGSSDAATTLLGLNKLWQLNCSEQRLMTFAKQLGADVPIFIAGKTAWAEGIGDQLTPIALFEQWFVVLTPNCHIDTRSIFGAAELERDVEPVKRGKFDWHHGHNSCQALVCSQYPEVKEMLDWLNQHSLARMTGTGSSVFAVFDSQAEAEAVFKQKSAKWHGFVTKGIQTSPTQLAI